MLGQLSFGFKVIVVGMVSQLLQITFKDVPLSRGRFGPRDWSQISERSSMEPHVLAPFKMGF